MVCYVLKKGEVSIDHPENYLPHPLEVGASATFGMKIAGM